MSLEDRVGQLFMVGSPVETIDPITLAAVRDDHVGGLFLHGPASIGVAATAKVVSRFTAEAAGPKLWVATDQEGGKVQVLSGPGFDTIPSALSQGRLPDKTLRSDAARWGAQLAHAGVNMNLAPVADIVTDATTALSNPPIGQLDREYGYTAKAVSSTAGAFAQGMRDAGIMPTFKHFPGLGHVGQNTDTTAGVTDGFVTSRGADINVYRKLEALGPSVVMVSTAVYANIDPSLPAAFSPTLVDDVLRGRVGFTGVIITDDLSQAEQVSAWSPADRATLAIAAGVDLLLVSADPSVFPDMYAAVLSKARSDPAFAAAVDAAVRRIVTAKSTTL